MLGIGKEGLPPPRYVSQHSGNCVSGLLGMDLVQMELFLVVYASELLWSLLLYIDNGMGAGIFASLIANRGRSQSEKITWSKKNITITIILFYS